MTERKVIWELKEEPASEDNIKEVSEKIPYTLPNEFISLMKISNGGMPKKNTFKYVDSEEGLASSFIGDFLSFGMSQDSLIDEYLNPPQFFPKDIFAFSLTGGGDYTCFDYREDRKTNNPPIVHWRHDAAEGKEVSFVANNFSEFMDMLYENYDEEVEHMLDNIKSPFDQ